MVFRPRAAARGRGSDGVFQPQAAPRRENVEGTSFRASYLALVGESELGEGGVLFAIGVALDHTLRAVYSPEGA